MTADYLECLRALAAEMEAGMAAIAGDSLSGFEDSLGRQESLSAKATVLARQLGPRAGPQVGSKPGPQLISKPGSQLISKTIGFKAAGDSLHRLNAQYAALLRHSGRSIALLSSLCGCYTGSMYREFKEARHTGLKHQTWHCEM